nr:unnamed protein product [Callosobruchus chinensis]
MRTVTNVFLLNLAISDLMLGVLCMPFTLTGALLRNFIFGEIMCKMLPFLQDDLRRSRTNNYIGNDLMVDIDHNAGSLVVTGNHCKVMVKRNLGRVKIVGDCCKVCISEGGGTIKYIGNGGEISLGLGVSKDLVTYAGKDGRITQFDSTEPVEDLVRSNKKRRDRVVGKCNIIDISHGVVIKHVL